MTATAACHTTEDRQGFCGIFPFCKLKARPQSITWLWTDRRLGVWKEWDWSYFVPHAALLQQNHSSENSWSRLLTKWKTTQSSDSKQGETNRSILKYTPLCKNKCRIYTAMDISTEPITVVMRKDWDDKCEVVGQDSFASSTGCCIKTVACVCEVLWQATATLTS